MAKTRRTTANIIYRGQPITTVLDATYTDNYDQTDDISLTLSDREMRWANDLFPRTGETLSAAIEVSDWSGPGDTRSIDLGKFEIDNVIFADVVIINGVAVPITSSARSEKKDRAWRQISLSGIAGDVAGNAGLALVYDTGVDPFYDVADQNNKSDLQFVEELCKSDGLCMKVTDGQLIIFEESMYEAKPAVATIIKGSSDIIGFPRFTRNAKDVYKACEISYFDPKTDETYTGYFEAPGEMEVGHTLRLRESFNSESDDINLDRKSRARLRERNKNEWQCNISLKGDLRFFAGTNVEFEGWGVFDGKYHIATCAHRIRGSGFVTTLSTRRCLEGY